MDCGDWGASRTGSPLVAAEESAAATASGSCRGDMGGSAVGAGRAAVEEAAAGSGSGAVSA